MFVDSHCHLADAQDQVCETVLNRARAMGVQHFLTIACDMDDVAPMAAFAAKHHDVSMTVGIHPHEATKTLAAHTKTDVYEFLEKAVHNPDVIGLGEMGYDFYYNHSDAKDQVTLFDLQLNLAAHLNLPVSIHTRHADKETLEHLKRYPQVTGVIHCFSGSLDLALGALELGYYISLSGIITFPKAQDIRDILTHVSLSRMLIETDSPFLAPVPHRGKTNEPSFLLEIAKTLSHIKHVPMEEVGHVTTKNFYTLFHKKIKMVQNI